MAGAKPLITQAFNTLQNWVTTARALDHFFTRTRDLMVEITEAAIGQANTTSGPGTVGCRSGHDACSEVTVPVGALNFAWKAFQQFGYRPEQLIVYSENPRSVTIHAPLDAGGNWGGVLDALSGAGFDWSQPRCSVTCQPPPGAHPVRVSGDFNAVHSGLDSRAIAGPPTVGIGASLGAFGAPTGRGSWPPRRGYPTW